MIFLRKQEVFNIHKRLIKEFGGMPGLCDENALESALIAAEIRHCYEKANIATCAATYAYHLTQSHAFFDGNKRIAATVSEVFLEINGVHLNATNDQIVDLFLNIAAGKLSRNEVELIFFEWVGSN